MANEKRLIAEALKKYHDAQFTPGVYEHSIFGKAALLLEADAVEVIRCKDCIHRHRRHNCDGRPMDFLCADGKRRTDG